MTTRGRPLKVFEPQGAGCCGAFILSLIGFGFGAMALTTVLEGGPFSLRHGLIIAAVLLVSAAVLAAGVAMGWRSVRERLLVFENGFVHRDWRRRERFVPWERLECVELRQGLIMRGSKQVIAWVRPEGEGAPEQITIGTVASVTGEMASGSEGLVTELAKHADLEPSRSGCLSMSSDVWRRRGKDGP